MLKKELKAALAVIGTMVPFLAQADQPTNGGQNQPALQQGNIAKQGQLPGAYNQSAACNLAEGWDVFVTGSFIYWNAQQEDMDVGIRTNAGFTDATQLFAKTAYKPGFKVGLGFDMPGMDYWDLYAEYTWFRSTNSVTHSAGSGFIIPVIGRHFHGDGDPAETASSVYSKWKLDLNVLDVALQRPFYWGRKLTANIGYGLRAVWLTQKADLSYSDYTNNDVLLGTGTAHGHDKSWALGPRVSLDTNWLLGAGFRIMGKAAASVLYTRYTTLDGSSNMNPDLVTRSISTDGDYNTLRAITETSLGLGWGSYFWDDQFHFDLSASYDFNIWWNQNMVSLIHDVDGAPGSLYIQGLNITARFDF
jgi:hypothetical protein